VIGDVFVTAFIADIHFGAMKSDQLYIQLQEYFLKVLDKKKIDLLVFGGDLFHNIITMNYSTSHIVLMFMENVIELCKANNIPHIRIIQGTISHDNNQLHNFHMFENRSDIDFKIIMNVTEEYFPYEKIRVLYIPEEYMRDPQEYYKAYIADADKKYDMIFGHGMVKEVAFIAKNQESENTMSKAPIFDTKQLINACKGPIYFGHIHIRTTVRKHVHYPGSFSRFRFGEEDPKGWFLSVYDTKTHKYLHEFIENKMAPEYLTVEVKLTEEYLDKPEKIVEFLKRFTTDYLRIKVLIDGESGFAVQYLMDTYKDNPSVKIVVVNEAEAKEEAEVQEVMDRIMDKYSFVFDPSLTVHQVIQRFIKVKNDRDIPIEIIEDELSALS
jgi:DNA repair exonuclease SbcCD nuclease subunit